MDRSRIQFTAQVLFDAKGMGTAGLEDFMRFMEAEFPEIHIYERGMDVRNEGPDLVLVFKEEKG